MSAASTPPPQNAEWTPPAAAGVPGSDPEAEAAYRAGFVDLVRSFTQDVLAASTYKEDAATDEAARASLARDMSVSVLRAVGAGGATPAAPGSTVDSLAGSPVTTPRRWEVAKQLARSVVFDASGVGPVTPPPESSGGDNDALQRDVEALVSRQRRESATAIQACLRGYAARHDLAETSRSALALLAVVREEVLAASINGAVDTRARASETIDRAHYALRSRLVLQHRAAVTVQRFATAGLGQVAGAEAWHAAVTRATVCVQAHGRALLSYTHKEVLRTNCFAILQRVSRGFASRRRLGAFRHALPLAQSASRAYLSLTERNARHAGVVARHVAVLEASWLAFVHAQRVRACATERANAGMCVVQGAARSALLQLLSRRLQLVRATQARPAGINRVLHRLLLFLPDEEEGARRRELLAANARRHEASVGVRRAATPSTAALGRTTQAPRKRGAAASQHRAAERSLSPQSRPRSRSAPRRQRKAQSNSAPGAFSPSRRRSPTPHTELSPVRPPAVAAAAVVSHQPDFAATISAMTRLVALSKVASTSVARREASHMQHSHSLGTSSSPGRAAARSASPITMPPVAAKELVRLAKRTAAASGAAKKKPDWH